VAAVANNTLEVVDLTGGKVINSLGGFKDTQDALFLGGDFNKLYVSSLDGHVRVFQGESFRLVQDFKIEPDPNRLFYDRWLKAFARESPPAQTLMWPSNATACWT
jgi:hypothetical protein